MAAKINRTGKTYGDLTVLETIPGSNSKADTYLVKCNCCGNTMIIGIDALLKGLKCKDCRGKDRKRTYQDLVGEEHNGIKVISLAEDAIGSTGHRNIRYNCMCSCGKEFVAYRSSLLRGKVKSCGCCKHITEASKMLVDNAEAMQDYDFAKNKDVDVSMLTQGSNIVVWWKCSACGTEWQVSVYHYIQRIKSCPICSTIDKGQTSFQEQAVAYYAKKYFSEAVIGNKKVIGKELDIYIPSIRTAVEYDGVRYHSDEKRVKNDEEKSEKCKQNGIRIIRIREHGLQEIRNSENIIRENNRGHATLDAAIRQCLEMLGVSEPNIDTQKDSKDIYRQYKDYKAERSMGGRHPELLKEWDYELNVGIDPMMVPSSSSEMVHWICSKCGHKWEAPINGRAKENATCPVCTTGKRRRNEKNNLATEHPEIVAEWDYEKNKNLKPEYFSSGSAEKCWWKCKNGHSYKMIIADRVYGHDCPECYKQKHFKSVICVETKERFSTAKEASLKYGISGGSPILNCCNKLRTVAGGYHWLFANEYESMTEEEADAFLKANPSRDKFVKKGRTYDLANMHFGKLKVIERAGSQNGHARWKCQCDCGNECFAITQSLVENKKTSCGHCNTENTSSAE